MISALARKRILGMANKFLTARYIKFEYTKGVDGGSYKNYKKLTESWGLKFADNRHTIVENFELQRKAWRAGVGPFCFGLGKFALGSKDYDGNPEFVYFYITEVAAVLQRGDVNNRKYMRELGINYLKYVKAIQRFFRKHTQLFWGDEADRNIGILRHRLVCIDFDKI